MILNPLTTFFEKTDRIDRHKMTVEMALTACLHCIVIKHLNDL